MEKKLPEIIRAEEKDKEQVKSVLKLGFSNDDLLRWVFPSADSFLKSFDLWMEEFSKESFKNNIVFSLYTQNHVSHKETYFFHLMPLDRLFPFFHQSFSKLLLK